MKEQHITMKISYGGFFIGEEVYFPISSVVNDYVRGTIIAAKIVHRRTSKHRLFLRAKLTTENMLLIRPDGDEQPVEVPADECYKCHDNTVQ